MIELKHLTAEAVPAALERGRRYRLLNEPGEAESICHDVLAVDPDNRDALTTLLLALTDQFARRPGAAFRAAQEALEKLTGDYDRAYYGGILLERRAKAALARGGPAAPHNAYRGLVQAMERFERAIELREPGNDEAVLRWNACARLLNGNPLLRDEPAAQAVELLE
jgi:tetratricopeptide (TPR) repeat protein